ncbi:hypothetical protein LA303_09455 [Candidatus Sulfidibacterium hydrothermale]|uniref:hypothetical protein n=1 Tax=Candidatus Sulfidibacterium hydrothermale TaxID=2875962 RepID=UPI001F0A3B2C|nr:hypothetical protein [Candidatus Sulfidibacterium hydrothermale]UBM61637.1 hypothetical protein LA303_09455 [Candidatus Sulfidibacterium hydrothermale]
MLRRTKEVGFWDFFVICFFVFWCLPLRFLSAAGMVRIARRAGADERLAEAGRQAKPPPAFSRCGTGTRTMSNQPVKACAFARPCKKFGETRPIGLFGQARPEKLYREKPILFQNGSKYLVMPDICGLFFNNENIKILLLGLHS